MERRFTPRYARSFGQSNRRPPGTRTKRWSSSPRRTTSVRSSAPSSIPWSSALSSGLPATAVRTTRKSSPDPSSAASAGVSLRSGVGDLDPDPLVDTPLRLVAGHPDGADLAGVGDVGAAIGLEVETDDLDGADLTDALGQQVDLRADEVGDREGLLARQDLHPDLAVRDDLLVHPLLDLADEVARHRLELE